MARKPGATPQAMRSRAAKTAAAMSSGSPLADSAPKKKTSPAQFTREVRAEARKITWTSRKETWITSVMVGIIVLLASIFVFSVDSIIGWAMGLILQLANAG